ncbi:MAG TPA: patatin-like phospholipase family protein [Burkholderiales bacterium]|nr:patatin-like phospholipase family protein [Burkholderiales bacterium]
MNTQKKIGLALSGGGFRATLYHLGLVRFLRDAGLLRNVTHITSVSGGSIIAAHLALHWERYNGSEADFDTAASELLAFIRLDVRNRIVRRFPLGLLLRPPRRVAGLSNRRLRRTGLLEYHYEKYLYGDRSLFELPETPELHILATNLSEGRLCSFNREGLLNIRREPGHGFRIERIKIGLGTVSMAVAASSAFPGFFPPMLLTEKDVGATSGAFGRQSFTDGGVFDNLGVRMFRFLANPTEAESHRWDAVLVSDTGKPFEVQSNVEEVGVVRTAMRASDILMDRVWQLESETFRDSAGFVFARIMDVADPKEDPTALHPEIQRQLPNIRTDLDRFNPLEISTLIRHGYCIGRKVCRALPQVFGAQLPTHAPWTPQLEAANTPAAAGSASPNMRDTGSVTRDARALHASGMRRIWRSLFDFRDWASYVYIPIIVPILVLTPYFSIKYYERSHRLGQIVQSIAQSSRDLEQMGRLLEGPVARFAGEKAQEVAPDDRHGAAGFIILQDLRMLDLRLWRPAGTRGAGHYLYGYRRLKVRKDPANVLNHDFRVSVLAVASDTQVRFPIQQLKPKLYVRNVGTSPEGQLLRHFQVGADLRSLPSDDAAEIVYEHISPGRFIREAAGSVSIAFDVEAETLELSRWILMPEGREYSSFQISRYRTGEPEPSENVRLMTEYLSEDRTILAFKLLMPDPGYTYEVTWFYR